MLFFGVKKNQALETLIAKVRMNQSNNYKDAALRTFGICRRHMRNCCLPAS